MLLFLKSLLGELIAFSGVTGSSVPPSPTALSARLIPKEWIVLYQRGKKVENRYREMERVRETEGYSGVLGLG